MRHRGTLLRALLLTGLAGLGLAGCAEDRKAPYEEIAARAYVDDSPPALTLYTVTRTADGAGAHSSLMISQPQRVLFDPAGSFTLPGVPERGDMLYGFSPRVQSVYIDFHARETYDVTEQTVRVSPEVAALALRLAQQRGAVGPAGCSSSISQILRQLPGFEGITSVMFPVKLSKQFAGLPGVETRVHSDDDADDNHGVLFQARDLFAEFEGQ